MQHVLMQATCRTRVGVLREGKWYSVPDDVVDGLEDAQYQTEAAVCSTPENAARRTGGVPDWPLKTPPADYIEQKGDDGPKSELAKQVLEARKEGADNA